MPVATSPIRRFFATTHPFDLLDEAALERLCAETETLRLEAGARVYGRGEPVPGLFAIAEGSVEIATASGDVISRLGAGTCFGERGLLADGVAPYDATALGASVLHRIPPARFRALLEADDGFARFFGCGPVTEHDPARPAQDIALLPITEVMSGRPITVAPDDTVAEAARVVRDRAISCVMVTEGERLVGVLTTGDLCSRVLAAGLSGDTPVREVMTTAPISLSVDALGLDAVIAMVEKGIGHLPVVDGSRAVGIVTRTNLLLQQALSTPALMSQIARADDLPALSATVAQVPEFLARLVGAGTEHQTVTRLVTDVTDALTRRLVALAEAELGPPPVPYCWAVCGSQGRQEQTGVSDQDNCLILSDQATPDDDAWFAAFAKRVSDGLNACGFVYCPGEMMATNPRWRQPLKVWRDYFAGWIETPDPMARMLASVMFDLRPVAGETGLLTGLQAETLTKARANSIFIAHMVANSLSHTPPLGLFRGFALIRSGEHKDALDLKLNGVVPVVDLARAYALMGGIEVVNTRTRLLAARQAGLVSETGGRELTDAYDMIAETRLRHQAELIRAGKRPDNFLQPASLSELERNHLRSAFTVVKTMQSALAQGRHTVI